jgi:transcriptional regulator NrdR family protein
MTKQDADNHADNDAKEKNQLFVKKEDGSFELFDQFKLRQSLVKSGAMENQADKIVHMVIEAFLDEGKRNHMENGRHEIYCSASEIYERAFLQLKTASRVVAARYSLRRSLLEFGPTGFPFEEYIAQLFRAKWGMEAVTDQVVVGSCVPHEVDVVAWGKKTDNVTGKQDAEEKLIMAEVKYHHDPGSKTDLKVTLYVKARYDDLKDNLYEYGGKKMPLSEGWLVTNTRFTDTAATYASCKNLKLLSWDFPEHENLQSMIESTMLHPVTCLTTLSSSDKRVLLEKDIVLAKTLFDNVKEMDMLGFSKQKIETVLDEVGEILKTVPAN